MGIEVSGTPKHRVNFNFLDSQDVFQKPYIDKLLDELKYLTPYADNESPAEYEENYCIQAAERGLSELLDNEKDFYAVKRTSHERKNRIGFFKKTAFDRGSLFTKKGFVQTTHVFNKFTIDHDKKDLIYNASDESEAETNYKTVLYDIVQLNKAGQATITAFFTGDLKGKEIGFHVYYFTVTNGFHTLILIIDKFTDPCHPTYEIWDQHGLSSSYGALADLPEGLRKQTSWTFANSCLNRFRSGSTKYFDSTKLQLWKIKTK